MDISTDATVFRRAADTHMGKHPDDESLLFHFSQSPTVITVSFITSSKILTSYPWKKILPFSWVTHTYKLTINIHKMKTLKTDIRQKLQTHLFEVSCELREVLISLSNSIFFYSLCLYFSFPLLLTWVCSSFFFSSCLAIFSLSLSVFHFRHHLLLLVVVLNTLSDTNTHTQTDRNRKRDRCLREEQEMCMCFFLFCLPLQKMGRDLPPFSQLEANSNFP